MTATAISIVPKIPQIRACLYRENSSRLVSLWDIVNKFRAHDFAILLQKLNTIEHASRQYSGAEILPPHTENIMEAANEIETFGKEVGFPSAQDAAMMIGTRIKLDGERLNASHIEAMATSLKDDLIKETFFRVFLVVDGTRSAYVDNDKLFGPEVATAFPLAIPDIRESGNCIAAGCFPAAIFHLMRIAEHGLRALAYDRRIRIPKGPLELATWEDILKELDRAESAIQGYPRTVAREAQFKFYHQANMEIRAFKNAWRNRWFHTRDSGCDSDSTQGLMNHVSAFMKVLASRISEGKRTPIIWKRVR